jgi:hypothetical protein
MDFAMVSPAKRDSELVADLATKRAGLCKSQMMRVYRASTADQAGLLAYRTDMLAVANPTRGR